MTMGVTWWTGMVNAVRFLKHAENVLVEGKSVLLNFPSTPPWERILCQAVRENMSNLDFSRVFDEIDGSGVKDTGKYLFERYLMESEQNDYWEPTFGCYENYLAQQRGTKLNQRIVCVRGIASGDAPAWAQTVSTYHAAVQRDGEHAVFLLLAQNASVHASESLACYSYTDYVSDYDCLMFCMTLLSAKHLGSLQKQYISEVAGNIANNNIEIAGALAQYGEALVKSPVAVVKEVQQSQIWHMPPTADDVNMAVWEAQIRMLFPKLEQFRRRFIDKYRKKLEQHLPIHSSDGERIESADDLELGHLYHLCKLHFLAEKEDFNQIYHMRAVRNRLAHWKPLTYEELHLNGLI